MSKISKWFLDNSWAILLLTISLIIWGVRLEATVYALDEEVHDKGAALTQRVEEDHEKLVEMSATLIRMETNQGHILRAMGIDPESP